MYSIYILHNIYSICLYISFLLQHEAVTIHATSTLLFPEPLLKVLLLPEVALVILFPRKVRSWLLAGAQSQKVAYSMTTGPGLSSIGASTT